MRIDTHKLRAAARELRALMPVANDFPNCIESAADALDATTPFASRAEVEAYLKEKGVGPSRGFHIADLADYDKGIDYVCLEDGTIYITGIPPNKNQRTLFQGNIKLLTPALLDSILEAK